MFFKLCAAVQRNVKAVTISERCVLATLRSKKFHRRYMNISPVRSSLPLRRHAPPRGHPHRRPRSRAPPGGLLPVLRPREERRGRKQHRRRLQAPEVDGVLSGDDEAAPGAELITITIPMNKIFGIDCQRKNNRSFDYNRTGWSNRI